MILNTQGISVTPLQAHSRWGCLLFQGKYEEGHQNRSEVQLGAVVVRSGEEPPLYAQPESVWELNHSLKLRLTFASMSCIAIIYQMRFGLGFGRPAINLFVARTRHMPRAHRARPRDGLHYRNLVKMRADSGGQLATELDAIAEPGQQNAKGTRKAKRVDFGRLDNNEVETPENVLQEICAEFGSFFDPCPFVGKGLTPPYDALREDHLAWQEFNFVNPPYDDIGPWMARAYSEMVKNNFSTLVLVPARTGSAYWRDTVWNKCTEVRFVTGKIIFKGYGHPSPHQMSCVIFRSEPERIAQSVNVEWPITKVLRDNVSMRQLYPALWQVVSEVRDVQGNYTHRPWAWQWMLELYTVEEFYRKVADGTLGQLTVELILPLYGVMLTFMKTQGYLTEHHHVSVREFPLPELLRRLAYDVSTDEAMMDSLLSRPVVIKPEHKQFVFSFYEAFMENAYIHSQTANRTHRTYTSYDTEFSLHCIEFK